MRIIFTKKQRSSQPLGSGYAGLGQNVNMRMGLLLFSVYGITLSCSGQPIPPLTNQLHLVGIRAIPFKIRIKDWTTVEDPEFDRAMAEMDRVDAAVWK